jgi:7-cyano-7-deazaguanine synthase in queuosine biosynthesis
MKFLLLNGGGLDSLAVAKLTRQQYPDAVIESIHFRCGHDSEEKLAAGARAIADAYCTTHDEYFLAKSKDGQLVPGGDMTVTLKNNFVGVPFWGAWLLVNGFVFATRRKADVLLTGIWADGYRPEILTWIDKLLHSSLITPFNVIHEAPLYGVDRALIHYIVEDDPVLDKTWSCNSSIPCRNCRKCQFRKDFNLPNSGA